MRNLLGASLLILVGGCAAGAPAEESAATDSALAATVCAEGETLKGVDVSYHNDTISWSKVKASGRVFAFARVSDGLTHIDTQFGKNWPGMKTAGLVRGAYQFFRPSLDPVKQADLLISKINANGGLKAGDLPPVLDLEVTSGQSAANVIAKAKKWLDRVQTKMHVKPIVYTGNNMSPTIGTTFKDYALWVPHYGVECPRVPDGWATWTFWQDGDKGDVPGVGGDVDTDFFNGSADDLDALRIKTTPAVAEDLARVADEFPDENTADDEGAVMGSGGGTDRSEE